jgi:hypothetical protein
VFLLPAWGFAAGGRCKAALAPTLAPVAGHADAGEIGVAVVVAAVDVINLGGRCQATHGAEWITRKNAGPDLRLPVGGQPGCPRTTNPMRHERNPKE